MSTAFVAASTLRREFSNRLSALYAQEVPLYGQLTEAVKEVNREVIRAHPTLGLREADVDHISEERHGAIRLGRDDELRTMADFFAVLGMQPVNFYDLSAAGAKAQPVISTAFRPVDLADIEVSPFRVFCSLLRPDDERFFDDPDLRRRLHTTLARREIFTPPLRELIQIARTQGGLDRVQADAFLAEGVRLFKWRGTATDHALYKELMARKLNIAADICCFPNPHLNHLTPNTLDIDALQARMQAILAADYRHLSAEMKDHIEGPPRRRAPILLRQTSYKALTEPVTFDGVDTGAHTARFGEIEQRGLALTPEGRRRYDEALAKVEAIRAQGREPQRADEAAAYAALPDDVEVLRREGLGFFTYAVTDRGAAVAGDRRPVDLGELIARGYVSARPIRYEDFLPVSAAGIFASNLRQAGARHAGGSPYTQQDLEAIMQRPILDSFALYAAQADGSRAAVLAALGMAGK
ncbi:MAG: VOC family protein [Candidatus Krumholzibacteria bacterium]|nr:VOC family protein [Candidatus Krumholzibacteria bacterium]